MTSGELPAVDWDPSSGKPVPPRQRMLGFPNFRDYGKTVDAALLRLVGNLSRRLGEAFISEGGLRRLLYEDLGHMAGVDTVRRALARFERRGLLEQRHLLPGGVLPDGSVCTHGLRLIVLVVTKRQRDWQRARRANRRRQGVTNRYEPRMAETLKQATAAIAREKAPPPVDDAQQEARKYADALRLAYAARELWEAPTPGDKPPE